MLLNIKERQRTKLFLKPSIKLLPFMAKSKGHASPPASERGNYPFPVREQQMIASDGGAFSEAEMGRRRRFNFLAAAYLLLSRFFPVVICCMFFFYSYERAEDSAVCLCVCEHLRVYLCALH